MSALEQLQGNLPPPEILWWPPAPGWWVLALLLACLPWLAVWAWRKRPKKLRPRAKKVGQPLDALQLAALRELQQLPLPDESTSAGPWLQALNQLLKRVCLVRYPEAQCQTLSGRTWLLFLDGRCTAAGLSRFMVLVEGQYRPEVHLPLATSNRLRQAVDTWIRQHV